MYLQFCLFLLNFLYFNNYFILKSPLTPVSFINIWWRTERICCMLMVSLNVFLYPSISCKLADQSEACFRLLFFREKIKLQFTTVNYSQSYIFNNETYMICPISFCDVSSYLWSMLISNNQLGTGNGKNYNSIIAYG